MLPTSCGVLQRIARLLPCGKLNQFLAKAIRAKENRIFGHICNQCRQCARVETFSNAVLLD